MGNGNEEATSREGLVARVTPGPAALRRIELRGPMPVGWAGRVAAGLAARGVGVVRGWARERTDHGWEAQLQVSVPPEAGPLTPAACLSFLDVTAPPRAAREPLRLARHHVRRSGAELVIELEAPDAHGFLDRALRLFALYGLFPRELHLETEAGQVRDLLHLRTLHGGPPEEATSAAVMARLRREAEVPGAQA